MLFFTWLQYLTQWYYRGGVILPAWDTCIPSPIPFFSPVCVPLQPPQPWRANGKLRQKSTCCPGPNDPHYTGLKLNFQRSSSCNPSHPVKARFPPLPPSAPHTKGVHDPTTKLPASSDSASLQVAPDAWPVGHYRRQGGWPTRLVISLTTHTLGHCHLSLNASNGSLFLSLITYIHGLPFGVLTT